MPDQDARFFPIIYLQTAAMATIVSERGTSIAAGNRIDVVWTAADKDYWWPSRTDYIAAGFVRQRASTTGPSTYASRQRELPALRCRCMD
jgi:hypothetical protein